MGNLLFQQARTAVAEAAECTDLAQKQELTEKAKNALLSAYANSSTAEKVQLREMQQQLQSVTMH